MGNYNLLLKMKGITKGFPAVTALESVDLELRRGEILALLGENGAGKSSLMKVLTGIYRPDKGTIDFKGERGEISSPKDAFSQGIGMIHQQPKLISNLTIFENIILGKKDLPLFPSHKEIEGEIAELAEQYNLKVNLKAQIKNLSVGEKLRVELLKMLYHRVEIFILDEPSEVLTYKEQEFLNWFIQKLSSEGKATIYITQNIDEAMAFSNRVQVLVRGKSLGVKKTQKTSVEELTNLLGGPDILYKEIKKETYRPGDPVLEVERLHSFGQNDQSPLKNINLKVKKGEILGIAGIAGNGQKELAEILTGNASPERGSIRYKGIEMRGKNPLDFIQLGVAYFPDARENNGSIGEMTLSHNLIMKAYRKPPITQKGILQKGNILDFVKKQIRRFQIKTPTEQTQIKYLAKGNKQKTILAREIDACDGLLVAVNPCRGLDINTADSIHQQLVNQRDLGDGVLLFSENPEELLKLSDRIFVLHRGSLMGILEGDEKTKENLTPMIAGLFDRAGRGENK